jgi:hypothetical protein
MKRIHMKYVIVTGTLLCLTAIYYYVAARMLLEHEAILVPAIVAVERAGTPLPVAITATSTWEQIMAAEQGGCATSTLSKVSPYGIATAGVPLKEYGVADPKILSFDFVQCAEHPVMFSAEQNKVYKIASSTSEREMIAQYWQLSSEDDAGAFITNLVATLPTELERTWCVVEKKQSSTVTAWQQLFTEGEVVYQVSLDQDYYTTPDVAVLDTLAMCAPYGNNGGTSFFKQIGNYLFLIPLQQTMPTFSPASFELL